MKHMKTIRLKAIEWRTKALCFNLRLVSFGPIKNRNPSRFMGCIFCAKKLLAEGKVLYEEKGASGPLPHVHTCMGKIHGSKKE